MVFTGVKSVYRPDGYKIQLEYAVQNDAELGVVVVQNGSITCLGGRETECFTDSLLVGSDVTLIDLEGGSVSPGLVSSGSSLGLEEIQSESSTTDGFVPESLLKPIPEILGGDFFAFARRRWLAVRYTKCTVSAMSLLVISALIFS